MLAMDNNQKCNIASAPCTDAHLQHDRSVHGYKHCHLWRIKVMAGSSGHGLAWGPDPAIIFGQALADMSALHGNARRMHN